jgi:hypothetical protein
MTGMPRLRALAVTLLLGVVPSACSVLVSTSGLSDGLGPSLPESGVDAAAEGSALLDGDGKDTSQVDAARPPPTCDLTKPFGAMAALSAPVNSPSDEYAGYFSPDLLTIYVASDRAGAGDLFVLHRPNEMAAWGDAIALDSLNTPQKDSDPWVSADQLTMYFDSARPTSFAGKNIFVTTRATATADFGAAVVVAAVASDADDREPWLTPAADRLYFASDRDGAPVGSELYVSERGSGGAFGPAKRLAELGSGGTEESPFLTADELTVYFASNRAGGPGGSDVWVATRTDKNAAFAAPSPVPALSTTADDYPSWLSDDGCRILIESYTTGNAELFYAERPK